MKKLLFLSLLFILNSSLFIINSSAQCTRPNTDFSACKYKTIGHRGYRHIYPENTLLSLEEAFKRGDKTCEIDISITKDSHFVLFHDGYFGVDRTTDGTGAFHDKTLSELKNLDAGSFKGYYFKGQQIPTLEEAMILAEKYDARLYLDVKDYDPYLIAKAIKNAGVTEDRVYTTSEKGLKGGMEIHKITPNTPWVLYNGGDYPDSGVADPNYYKALAKNGCVAIEVSYFIGGDSTWHTFDSLSHAAGLEIWVFTCDMNDQILNMKKYHMDRGEADRSWDMGKILCEGDSPAYPDSLTTGNWRFSNTLKGLGQGAALSSYNYINPNPKNSPSFNTCSGFGIAKLDGQDANVMLMPKQDSLDAMMVYTDFSVQDNGGISDYWTMIIDLLVPDSSQGQYISLLSTSIPPDKNDGDIFIHPKGGVGIQGDYGGNVSDSKWHRLVLSFDYHKGSIFKFIDGKYVGKNNMFGTRWSVYNSTPAGQKHGFFLLSDNDGESAPVYVSALQVRDYAMDSLTSIAMGKPTANGIPMGNADLYNLKIAGDIPDSTLMDYDNQTYYLVVSKTVNLKKAYLSFDPSYGATTSRNTSSIIDLSSGTAQITVTSEDKSRTKKWNICVKQAVLTDVAEVDKKDGVSIYPNPANDRLNIKLTNNTNATFTITDVFGKTILKNTTPQEENEVDITQLSKGVYFIMIQKEGSAIVKKFVKM
ncbi:MAG: glycerophosphodiester phosphodiesterase family protein [Bacteroidetes bacterium]|nr:glycerophosphodiester phosphodiesterase family protein [Bacteroidota bacterium]